MVKGKQSVLDEQKIREGAPFAAISYVCFLWIIAFILKRDNEFAHHHARQGLVIFVAELSSFVFRLIPVIGVFFYKVAWLLFFVLSIYGIYSSLTGKLSRIPVVADIASKLVV